MITSKDNPKVRLARSLLERRGREEQGLCLLEGVRLIEDALRAGVHPALLFYLGPARAVAQVDALLGAIAATGVPVTEVSPEVFATLSGTVSSQGIVAVVPLPQIAPPANPILILVLDQVRDPGNLGTILRSAAAAGAGPVLLTTGCTDAWSPKALRAGMGAHFRLAMKAHQSWAEIAQAAAGRQVWVADPRGETAYDQIDWTRPSLLILSGETTGLSPEAAGLGGRRVTIPMEGETESLNVAMAATVLLFEAARQRRRAGYTPL